MKQLELLLSIGGMTGHVVLEAPSPEFAAEATRRFAAFALPPAPHVERAFSVRIACVAKLASRGDGPPPPLFVRATESDLTIRHGDFEVDLVREGGVFIGRGQTRATGFSFESILRVLWSALLPQAGGALFHACGLHEGGRAFLGAGESGAGKTTLAKKAADEDILSDEVVAVHRGADGTWRASATPFFGELQRGGHSMRSYPLAGLALLEKRAGLAVTGLPLGQAVKRALGCLMCFETDAATAERNFGLVVSLVQEVPTFVCGSRADTPLLAVITAIDAHLGTSSDNRSQTAPDNTRELVSALRANLHRHGRYAFAPHGGSMRPLVPSGEGVFVETVAEDDVRVGDIVLCWRVGRTPERDRLICHRVLGRVPGENGSIFFTKGDALGHVESFATGTSAALVGRVSAVCRAGQPQALPGRIASLAIACASAALVPLLPFLKLGSRP